MDMNTYTKRLVLKDDGIWYQTDHETISYPSEGNEENFKIEDESFWYNHRNDCICAIIKKYPPIQNEPLFDVGGGNGFVSRSIMNLGFDVVLVEPGYKGAKNAQKRGVNNIICSTLSQSVFHINSMAAIGMFDVLEHIEDDRGFLGMVLELLKKNGRLYLTLPAYSFLWSYNDVYAGHFRRYRIKSICSLLQEIGFKIIYSSYIFTILPLPIYLFRSLPYQLGFTKLSKPKNENIRNSHKKKASFIHYLLNKYLELEIGMLSHSRRLLFGGSCIIVAEK